MAAVAVLDRVLVVVCSLALLVCFADGQLSATFYSKTCANVSSIVRSGMTQAVQNEARMGASILRLFFHDCFVNGCDGSILLDDNSTFTGEKNAGPNANSARGFDIVDTIKSSVEASCPGVVSCADILALAARDGVVFLGGPTWIVKLGRRDATTASQSAANSNLPAPSSSLAQLKTAFANKNLNARDLTALSGAHTIGQARCVNFRSHIYNDSNINSSFATQLQQICPSSGGDNTLAPLDTQTPTVFDNDYYQNLVVQKGLLHSDQELFNNGTQDSLVRRYSTNAAAFNSDFAAAMVKMGNISPLTGSNGEIRLNCRKGNAPTWKLQLGRDATNAGQSVADSNLPGPGSSLAQLISAFSAKGLSADDMTALSGARTVGLARCANFRSHIYNDTLVNASFVSLRKQSCPSSCGDGNLVPLDAQTATAFDSSYYQNLVAKKGLLRSDQELFNNGSQDSLVRRYSTKASAFNRDFAAAMVGMGSISPLTGSRGRIRLNCRKVN